MQSLKILLVPPSSNAIPKVKLQLLSSPVKGRQKIHKVKQNKSCYFDALA